MKKNKEKKKFFTRESLKNFKSIKERRDYLEKKLGLNFKAVANFYPDEKIASEKNCENMIGSTQLPLGVAGPLKIKGEFVKGNFFLPLATTEGALVASVNRGCKAIFFSGGVKARVRRIGATRGPVFYTHSLGKKIRLENWLKKNQVKIKELAERTDPYLKFERLETDGPADYLFLRFYFNTNDAMGMNMATIASQEIVRFIEKKTKIKCLSLTGNLDADKKPAWMNFIKKRGFEAWAEISLSEKIIKSILKTNSAKLFDVWLAKSMIGSALSGSLSFNAHFANIIAALFIATGQDPGHIAEGSMGITTMKKNKKLYFSVYLPDLMIGTVGGGTGLSCQKEALKLLKVEGGKKGKNSLSLAEIIGGAVLAGELSLLASLAENSLAKAHLKLARGII